MEACHICFEEYKEGDSIETTPCCTKKFHTKCLDKLEKMVCPLCRAELPDPPKPYNIGAIMPMIDIICCHSCDSHEEEDSLTYHAVNIMKKVNIKEMLTRLQYTELKKHQYLTAKMLEDYNCTNLNTVNSILNDVSDRNLSLCLDNRVSYFLDYESHIYITDILLSQIT